MSTDPDAVRDALEAARAATDEALEAWRLRLIRSSTDPAIVARLLDASREQLASAIEQAIAAESAGLDAWRLEIPVDGTVRVPEPPAPKTVFKTVVRDETGRIVRLEETVR